MAAGVHLAGYRRGIWHPGLFLDRQRIHVGAQADNAALAVRAPFDHGDHACPANALHHLVTAEGPTKLGDPSGRSMDVEQKLGVLMEIAAPSGDFR